MKCICLFGFQSDYITSKRNGVACEGNKGGNNAQAHGVNVSDLHSTVPPRADFQVLSFTANTGPDIVLI